jgi:hypothetical protein
MKYFMCIFFKQITIGAIIHNFIEKFLTLRHSQDQYFNRGIEFLKETAFSLPLGGGGSGWGKNVS